MCNNTIRYSEPYPSVVFVQYKQVCKQLVFLDFKQPVISFVIKLPVYIEREVIADHRTCHDTRTNPL